MKAFSESVILTDKENTDLKSLRNTVDLTAKPYKWQVKGRRGEE